MRLVGVAVLVVALCASGCVSRVGGPSTTTSSSASATPVAVETDDWERVTEDDWGVSFAMPEPVEDTTVPFPDYEGTPLDGYRSVPAPGLQMDLTATGVDGGDLTEDDLTGLAHLIPDSLGANGGTVLVLDTDTVDGRLVLDAKITYIVSGDALLRMTRLIGDGDWLYLLSTTGPTTDTKSITEFQEALANTLEID